MNYPVKFFIRLFCCAVIMSLMPVIPGSSRVSAASLPPGFMDMKSSVGELTNKLDKAFPSIVIIIVYDIAGEETARGSGFFYDTEGRILTNAGILKNAYSAKVISQTRIYDNVSILAYDEALDAAVIKVKAVNEVPLIMDLNGDISVNDKVMALGMSAQLNKTVSEGTVSSLTPIGDSGILIHGNTVAPLLSLHPSDSGPLLNSDGKVIGLTTYAISDNPSLNSKDMLFADLSVNAVSIRSLKPLLENSGSATALHPAGSRVQWQWLKYKIKTAVTSAFVFLYETGFTIVIAYVLFLIVIISFLQWLIKKIKRKVRITRS